MNTLSESPIDIFNTGGSFVEPSKYSESLLLNAQGFNDCGSEKLVNSKPSSHVKELTSQKSNPSATIKVEE